MCRKTKENRKNCISQHSTPGMYCNSCNCMNELSVEFCSRRFYAGLLKSTHFLTQACLCCLQDPSLRGIFHYSGKEQMTKYEIACAIADAFNLPSSHLIPVSKHTEDLKEFSDHSVCMIPYLCMYP